ncbi:MAG: FliM/FliN family flagellar motor switch protein [Acidobacteriota bacterium]
MALPPAPAASLDALAGVMDVPCTVDFILGTAVVKVRDCVQFAPRSVVRLKQAAGADLELRAGGVAIASGEVVIVDENVGLRLNRILPPAGAEKW